MVTFQQLLLIFHLFVCQQTIDWNYHSSCMSTTFVDVMLKSTPQTLLNDGNYDQFWKTQKPKHGREVQPIRRSLPTERQTQQFTWECYDEAGNP